MPSSHLLIVDDDQQLAEMLSEYLAPENIVLDSAATGRDGLKAALHADYDLIILDVMLPGLSGFDVLRSFREAGGRTPILMLTARGDDVDRIVGLEMGADDYLAKPFNPRELLARVKAILRRTAEANHDEPAEIVLGPVRADTRRRDAWVDGQRLQLTNAEFVILVTLMKSPGGVVSRELLTRVALGRQLLPSDRSLDTHISNLRRKLSAAGGSRLAIRSIRGTGYTLIPPMCADQ
jgi:two-component system response regulator CpxR